uniref:Deoxyhypusine hydroxylase n=1 Tax=Clastoptera arizonana TaxID=38151 RepID=A0A1B6CET4_9HEMI
MISITDDQIKRIGLVLKNDRRPLKERFRALFTLKNIGGSCAIECIIKCFDDSSALLKHELAYCLGQMQDKTALPVLISILKDQYQEPMVRHEAAEAIGAIGCINVLDILEEYAFDPVIEVAETCQLAKNSIKWQHHIGKHDAKDNTNHYDSVDPAPPFYDKDFAELESILLNDKADLFERYRAMFALRNLKTEESILSLCKGLNFGSALFRHEIAFVLGQLQEEISVPFLIRALEDKSQNEMVRHECAEALGSIATHDCLDILKKYLNDDKRVVKESCEIALDMCEYENSPEFQYADTLSKV